MRREDERTRARRGARLTVARVVALVGRRLLLDAAKDGARDVVAAVAAGAFTARQNEEGGGVLDDDALDVGGLGDPDVSTLLAQLDLERLEVRRDDGEAPSCAPGRPGRGGSSSAASCQDGPARAIDSVLHAVHAFRPHHVVGTDLAV